MTTCREAKQRIRRCQNNWNGVTENFKGSGSWKNSGIGAGALLALMCCLIGLVWVQPWDVNGMKQELGGKFLSPLTSLLV